MLLALEDQFFQQSLQQVYTNICNASFSTVFLMFEKLNASFMANFQRSVRLKIATAFRPWVCIESLILALAKTLSKQIASSFF